MTFGRMGASAMEEVRTLAKFQDASAQPDRETPVADDAAARNRQQPGAEPWLSDHAVNLRVTLPLLFGRYYLAVVMGKERRSEARLASERKKHPLITLGNVLLMLGCGTVVGLALLEVIGLAAEYYFAQRVKIQIVD